MMVMKFPPSLPSFPTYLLNFQVYFFVSKKIVYS